MSGGCRADGRRKRTYHSGICATIDESPFQRIASINMPTEPRYDHLAIPKLNRACVCVDGRFILLLQYLFARFNFVNYTNITPKNVCTTSIVPLHETFARWRTQVVFHVLVLLTVGPQTGGGQIYSIAHKQA